MASAALAIKSGHLVAFPTETVYGLGANAQNEEAVAKIYQAKGRPSDHPLIVHIDSLDRMGDWAIEIPEYATKLAGDYWPGPMTLVLQRSNIAKDFLTGGQSTVGLRVPAHPLALALLAEFAKIGGLGIAAPSANRFGKVSPTTAQGVEEELADYLQPEDLILDGGPSLVGVESTIIDCTTDTPKILRPGAITEEMITETTGQKPESPINSQVRVSGSLDSHYAPLAEVLLDIAPRAGDGLIAPAFMPTPVGVTRLSSPINLEQYARELYEALREADRLKLKRVVAIQPEGDGFAAAIRDRLARSAHRG